MDSDLRDEAIATGVDKVKRKKSLTVDQKKSLLKLLEPIRHIGDPMIRCRALTRFYNILSEDTGGQFENQINAIFTSITTCLEEIDSLWERIHLGFEAVALIAPHSPEHAQSLLDVAETAKRDSLLQTDNSAGAYIGTLQLAIAAYSGLFVRKLADDNDLNRLGVLINKIPSDGERARIWSEVAVRAYFCKRLDLCQSIVKERVRPLIEVLQRSSPYNASEVVSKVAAALYLAHPTSAKEDFKNLTPQNRDIAYSQICRCILEKRTALEPFDPDSNHVYSIDYQNSLEIIDIVEQFHRDSIAFNFISDLTNSLPSSENHITRDQNALISAKIETFAANHFPSTAFITHTGYGICTRALNLKLKQQPKAKSSDFDNLIAEAYLLPNESDKIFTLCTIASAIHTRDRIKKQKLLDDAYQISQTLPCVYDRIARIRLIASDARSTNEAFSKLVLESGMQIAIEANHDQIWSLQRQMLDFAFRLDPDYAAKLVASADTDRARVQTRLSLQHRLDVLNTTKSISEKPKSRQREKEDKDDYPQAAWRLLGQLNAGRVVVKPQEELREFIEFASQLPFSRAYPIFAWVIGNSVTRFSNTDQAKTVLRPIFEATLLGCEISARMADQNSRVLHRTFLGDSSSITPSSTNLIQAGERDLAISRIRVWIEQKVTDYLTICDPFFGPADLDILKLVLAFKPSIQVRILTSLKYQMSENVEKPYPETYASYWRTNIADQDPPDTEIMLVGTQQTNDSPIHDRWWLTANSGLRLGTSFQSLGVGKVAELSELSEEVAVVFEATANGYLRKEIREHKGEKLKFVSFSL